MHKGKGHCIHNVHLPTLVEAACSSAQQQRRQRACGIRCMPTTQRLVGFTDPLQSRSRPATLQGVPGPARARTLVAAPAGRHARWPPRVRGGGEQRQAVNGLAAPSRLAGASSPGRLTVPAKFMRQDKPWQRQPKRRVRSAAAPGGSPSGHHLAGAAAHPLAYSYISRRARWYVGGRALQARLDCHTQTQRQRGATDERRCPASAWHRGLPARHRGTECM